MECARTRGEVLHEHAAFKTLFEEFFSMERDHASQVAFFQARLPAAAAVGCIIQDSEMDELAVEARRYTDIIFSEPANKDKTGVSLGLNGVPPNWFSDLKTFLWAQSNVLSPSQIARAEKICVQDGATYQIVLMPQPTREGGYGGVHYEGILIPNDYRDGAPLAITVALAYGDDNPLARQYVTNEYSLTHLRPSEVTSDLSMMFADPGAGFKVGPENILLPLREDKWHLTIVETLGHQKAKQEVPKAGDTYGRVLFPAECVLQ